MGGLLELQEQKKSVRIDVATGYLLEGFDRWLISQHANPGRSVSTLPTKCCLGVVQGTCLPNAGEG